MDDDGEGEGAVRYGSWVSASRRWRVLAALVAIWVASSVGNVLHSPATGGTPVTQGSAATLGLGSG